MGDGEERKARERENGETRRERESVPLLAVKGDYGDPLRPPGQRGRMRPFSSWDETVSAKVADLGGPMHRDEF